MKTIVQIKQEIVQSLRNFQSPIRITHSRATEYMNEVMREHPELLFYIQSYSARQEISWEREPCIVYTIVYGNNCYNIWQTNPATLVIALYFEWITESN